MEKVKWIMFLFTACLSSEFACNDTGTCIPGYLTRDGLPDCDDSSDECEWLHVSVVPLIFLRLIFYLNLMS